MRKPLHTIRKIFTSYFVFLGILLLVFVVVFLKSGVHKLILPPTQQKSNIASSNSSNSVIKQTTQNQDALLKRICMKYGNIEFIMREQVPIEDEINSFGFPKMKTVIYTSVLVPDSIRVIAGLDENFTYLDRMKAADALGNNLTAAEQRALLHFLHKRQEDDKLTPLRFNSVKNQVCIALMKQVPANQEFPLHLIAMFNEKQVYSRIWRDYCIQFLGQYYDKIATAKHKQAVRLTLFKALEETQDIAAPAIIAIDGLSRHGGFIKKEIAKEAYKLVADKESSYIVKIPALQIAARYNHPKAVELARDLLIESAKLQSSNDRKQQNSKPVPVILQMSALATLGDHGEQKDISLLKKYRKSADIRLRSAAKTALKKLM